MQVFEIIETEELVNGWRTSHVAATNQTHAAALSKRNQWSVGGAGILEEKSYFCEYWRRWTGSYANKPQYTKQFFDPPC